MAPVVDGDARSLVSAGEDARWVSSRWALPCI